ncbi:MAG: hypothetical protein IIC78_00360 [Chloroflexi bacterium]|nr:hypothetical protein [Chloroflexota bacterium]
MRASPITVLAFPIIGVFVLAACGTSPEIEIPLTNVPAATNTPKIIAPTLIPTSPPRTLVVCLGREPSSLYLYANTRPEADTILQALYDGPIDLRSHRYEPVILASLPSFDNGGARVESVIVSDGQVYLNPQTLVPDRLASRKPYLPSDCSDPDCITFYTEGDVAMDRIVAEFELLPDVRWSDGEELKASDSVFSFKMDGDTNTPTTKYLVQRTSSYTAQDKLRTQWVGIPGFLDPEFESNFWSPLPEHILGQFAASELLVNVEAARTPLGWGPYIIQSWESGKEIVLVKSQSYFRSGEDLPFFDLLRFRFLGSDYVSALEQVLTGECDVLDESAFPFTFWPSALDLAANNRLQIKSQPGAVMERIDFNTLGAEGSRAFSDLRARRAFEACIDRQGIVDELLFGLSPVPDSYLPSTHPLYVDDPSLTALSVAQANRLLEEIGWIDDDDDPSSPRTANAIFGIRDGTPFEVKFLTTGGALHEVLTKKIQEDLANCGIGFMPEFGDSSELFEPWPNGPIFGGRFETVGWAWPVYASPPCEMFAGFEVPTVDNLFGINATGFRDLDYDRACRTQLLSPPGGEIYQKAIEDTQRIFRAQIPSIPLFNRPRIVIFGIEICGPDPDPTSFSVLWNIEQYAAGDRCENE